MPGKSFGVDPLPVSFGVIVTVSLVPLWRSSTGSHTMPNAPVAFWFQSVALPAS